MRNCISCNAEIAEHYKFCPSCGNSQEVQQAESKDEIRKVIVKTCTQCGDDNDSTNDYCSGCGISLADINPVEKQITISVPVPSPVNETQAPAVQSWVKTDKKQEANKEKKKPAPAKTVKQNEVVVEKTSNTKSIAMLSGAIVILALAILFASGVFETETAAPPAAVEHQHAEEGGVDLALMQQLGEMENRVKAQPENLEMMLELAHGFNDAGVADKAIFYYQKYLGLKPQSPEVIIDMGTCYFNLKKFEQADSIMRTALKLAPDHPIGLYNLGIVNLSKGDVNESKKWFERVIKVHPNSKQAEQAKKILESH